MISVKEASDLVFSSVKLADAVALPIENLHNAILKQPIAADRDYPPFDRVAMDGISISFLSLPILKDSGLPIAGIQKAGSEQLQLVEKESCFEVMTGASLPMGTDTVIPYEHVEIKLGKAYLIQGNSVEIRQNIHFRGSDYKKGDCLLESGTSLGPAQWSILASVGSSSPMVFKKPRIAVIATGDELVNVKDIPKPHQIRMSNTWAIKSMLSSFHFQDVEIFSIKDQPQELMARLDEIIQNFDVLVLSGGVSMGKYDFVPQVLRDLEVEEIFHKVAQRPGKPFWFGLKNKKTIFGLPGNPVSTLTCCRRYVIPSLQLANGEIQRSGLVSLAEDISFPKPMTWFKPVKIFQKDAGLWATPISGNGSGDFMSLSASTGFVEMPAALDFCPEGTQLPYYSWTGELL